jgi:hypothetical protein
LIRLVVFHKTGTLFEPKIHDFLMIKTLCYKPQRIFPEAK